MKLHALLFLGNSLSASALVLPRTRIPAPYHRLENASLVPDEYLVLLYPNHTLEDHFTQIGLNLAETASAFSPIDIINGYSARLDLYTIHELIRYDPGVRLVEHNTYIVPSHEMDYEESYIPLIPSKLLPRWSKQWWASAIWHFVMIGAGKRLNPLPDEGIAESLADAGSGVVIYILDTGIRLDHLIFRGMANNFQNTSFSKYVNEPMADTDGHGTHVAGIASNVAPGSYIVNVKVIGDGANTNNIAKAINDVTKEHIAYKNNAIQRPANWRGSVINMSILVFDTVSFREALAAAFQAGIPIAVAAGNSNEEATQAPCSYTGSTVCVGACDQSYKKSTFSNYGPNIQIIAPGTRIYSAGITAYNAYTFMSGTSMAAPFVAGVWTRLDQNALIGVIEGFPENPPTRNLFLNNGINNRWKEANVPYYGAPGRELAFENDPNTNTAGPVSTITTSASQSYPTEIGTFEGPVPSVSAAASSTITSIVASSTLYCTDPSLEDGDGICTCNQGSVTTTITPAGGPGNACPTIL